MEKLTLNDVLPPREYVPKRDAIRAVTLEHKKQRRLAVGPVLAFTFEDRQTMKFQIMEMCRVEHLEDPEKIQAEIDVYNSLLPDEGELSATMFLELTSDAELREWLPKLPGVEQHVGIKVGDHLVRARGEEGRSTEETTSSVHYLRFPFSAEARDAFVAGELPAAIAVDHPSYRYEAEFPPEVRTAVAKDFK